MSRRTNLLLAGAALAAFAAAGATAVAQPAPRPAPEPGAHAMHETVIERDGKRVVIRREGHEAMGADRAEHLRNILQLRPNQEAALTAYLASQRMDHEGMMKMGGDGPAKTTPERLARMDQHLAQMKARLDATRRFYDQLDAGQKKAFDELPLMMGGGHMGGPMRAMKMRHAMPPMPAMPPMRAAPPTPPGV